MLKYKNIFSIALLFVLIFTSGVFAQQFDDVPRDHWAYDRVQYLGL